MGADLEPPVSAAGHEQRIAAAVTRLAVWSGRYLLIVAAVAVTGWLLGRVWSVLFPVLLALLVASVLWPVTRLLRRRLPPAPAALATVVAAVAVLAGIGFVVVPEVVSQAQPLADAVADGLTRLSSYLAGPPFHVHGAQLSRLLDQLAATARGHADSVSMRLLQGLSAGVATVGGVVVRGLLTVLLCFFFLKDGPKFLPWLHSLTGDRTGPHLVVVLERAWVALAGYVRTQAVVGAIDAATLGAGLLVLRVPLVLPLVVLIYCGCFVPVLGATVTGAIAALVALVACGPHTALAVVGLAFLVQQVEGHVLQPLLMGRALQLHGGVVVVAVAAGGALFGVPGALLAVPAVAAGTAAVRYGREQLTGVPTTPPAGRNRWWRRHKPAATGARAVDAATDAVPTRTAAP